MFFIAKEADFTLYRYVIFDLDGTLLNTLEDLAAAGEYVCAQNGWPAHTLDEYRYFVGNGIPKLCERFSPADQRSPERLAQTLEQFTRYYDAHKEDATAPYPGIEDLLDALQAADVVFGVLTNKAHPLAKGVLEHYFPDRFAFVQGAKPGVPVKQRGHPHRQKRRSRGLRRALGLPHRGGAARRRRGPHRRRSRRSGADHSGVTGFSALAFFLFT